MAAPKRLYLEGLRVGDELPTLVKPAIDRVQLARFAGASGDFNPMHVDEFAARSAGMPAVFANPLLPMAFMAQFMTDWLRGGRMTRLAVRFVKLVWPGDVLSCKGRVLSRRRDDQGRYFVDVDIWAENQRGELVLKGHATGQTFYSAEDESRQKRGEPPLIVDVSEQTELPRNAKGKPMKPKPVPGKPTPPARLPPPAPKDAQKKPSLSLKPHAPAKPAHPKPHSLAKPKLKPKPKAKASKTKKKR